MNSTSPELDKVFTGRFSILLPAGFLLFIGAGFICFFNENSWSQMIVLACAIVISSLLACFILILGGSDFRKDLSLGTSGELPPEELLPAETLKLSAKSFHEVFESASDIIFTTDLAGNFISLNKSGEEKTGYLRDELIGTNFSRIVLPEDLELVSRMIAKKHETDVLTKYIVRVAAKDGKILTLELTTKLIVENGTAVGIQGIACDLTASEPDAPESSEKSEQYENLFKHANDAILVIEPASEVVLNANDKACELYGFRREYFIGMSLKALTADVTRGEAQIQSLFEQEGACQEFETVQFRADGTELHLLVNAAVIEYEGHKAVLSINRDITERRRMESESQVISEIIQGISKTSNLDELLVIIHESLKKILYAENCFVALHDKKTDMFTMRFYVDQIDEAPPTSLKLSRSCSRYVFRTGRPLLMNKQVFDLLAAQGEVDLVGAPPVCWIGTPLRTPTETIGVLVVQHYEDMNAYSQRDLELLSSVADQIAIAIQRKRAEDMLRESEYSLRTLLESMSEGLVRVNNNEVIEFVNDRFCEMTGYTREELIGSVTLDVLFDEEGQQLVSEANRERLSGASSQYELRLKRKSNETIDVIVGGAPIINADGVVTGTMGIFTNISERKRAEEKLLHDALHDALTGLANRTLFMDHLRMTIERAKRHPDKLFAVLFLDFDRFKIINDSLGHAEGDNLLKSVAGRLEAILRPGDLVARLGGDEFTILLSELECVEDAGYIAERIQEDLKIPFELGGQQIFISASIGIKINDNAEDTAENMLRDADIAMYRAKAAGKAQHQIFDFEMHAHATTKLKLETEMRQALEREEFELYYQPIIKLGSGCLMGFEALVRWNHKELGLIPPIDFIPAAEENGLILPLGQWILQEACRQLRGWQTSNPAAANLTVSVNLSCKQFLQFDLTEQIAETLDKTGLSPRCLKLEITESNVMENTEIAVTMMNKLRRLGVKLSLDDFGTGYSSLSYLHRLPVDYLKIDRSFISRIVDSAEHGEIVYTIIKLAQNLRMKVIAEGIETAEQLSYLKNLACEFGQGYFFARPLPAGLAEEFIDSNEKKIASMMAAFPAAHPPIGANFEAL